MVLLQLKDLFGLFIKRREFLPNYRILTSHEMTYTVESEVKMSSSSLAVCGFQSLLLSLYSPVLSVMLCSVKPQHPF